MRTKYFTCLVAVFFFFACFAPRGFGQATLQVEPGLAIPNDDFPWVLDKFNGANQVVPLHRSSANINSHLGANLAGAAAGSFFYKPKLTTELPGSKARTVIHDLHPTFYFRVSPDPDGNPTAATAIAGWEIVRANVKNDKRIFQQVRITALTNHGKRTDSAIDSETEQVTGGWTKITPKNSLEPGEYALAPIFKDPKFMSTAVFDFSLDPAGPNAPDAIVRKSTP